MASGTQPRPPLSAPSLERIQQAARDIADKAVRTPLVRLNWRSEAPDAPEIFLKLENLQPIGSFKVRPAASAIASCPDKEALRKAGVCTASAGNFAQGLAWCCAEMGVVCSVVVPDVAPETKLEAMRRQGATVQKVPYSEWWEIIESHECPQVPGAHFIHPGAEDAVLAGNATIGYEILEDLPDADCIVVPYGSGSVCTGVACAVKAVAASKGVAQTCRVCSAEPATAAPFALSKKAGKACKFEDFRTSFVDGCGGKAVLEEIWELANDVVHDGYAVPLDAIANSVRVLTERNRIVAEGAGACPVAAAMTGMCGPDAKKIVCVVSGGGLDTSKLIRILQGESAEKLTAAPKRSFSGPALGFAVTVGLAAGWLLSSRFAGARIR